MLTASYGMRSQSQTLLSTAVVLLSSSVEAGHKSLVSVGRISSLWVGSPLCGLGLLSVGRVSSGSGETCQKCAECHSELCQMCVTAVWRIVCQDNVGLHHQAVHRSACTRVYCVG